jgi:hypothetical protein
MPRNTIVNIARRVPHHFLMYFSVFFTIFFSHTLCAPMYMPNNRQKKPLFGKSENHAGLAVRGKLTPIAQLVSLVLLSDAHLA